MKIVKIVAITVLVLLIAGIGLYAEAVYRFDLQLNSTTRYIKNESAGKPWGTRISLLPERFPQATTRAEVEQQLTNAGFVKIPEGQIWARFEKDIEQKREIYSREADNLICNIRLYVFVSFDETNTLVFAESTQYEHGCL